MSAEQLTLADAPITSGSHRHADRQTSVDAARSMQGRALTVQQLAVLQVVAACWQGATAYEIAQQTGYQQSVMSRRLCDLIARGLVVYRDETRPGSSGRPCSVAEITERGREWAYGTVDVAVTGERL